MAKATTQGFTAKTHGWQVGPLFIDEIVDQCRDGMCLWTANYRLAFAEEQHIDLAGIAVKDLIAFPVGWSVQEIEPPKGWCQGEFNDVEQTGMPWYAEVHDLWTTRQITVAEFEALVGDASNNRYGPGMLGAGPIQQTSSTMDFEQVVAARSRVWSPDLSNLFGYGSAGEVTKPNVNVRLQFGHLVHDNVWGSGEPIASTYLYHTRIYITNLDAEAYSQPPENGDVAQNGTFCTFPSSIQPMLAVLDEPNFITRMTYKRRSLDV